MSTVHTKKYEKKKGEKENAIRTPQNSNKETPSLFVMTHLNYQKHSYFYEKKKEKC